MAEVDNPGVLSLIGTQTMLYRLRLADLNTTADQIIPPIPGLVFSNFVPTGIIMGNPSVPITGAVGGVYTGPNKTGVALLPASQSWSSLSSVTKIVRPGLPVAAEGVWSAGPLYLSLTTPMGSPANATILLMGIPY